MTTVFTGKERVFNRRFLLMSDHYMIEPTACSPAAGWEKGQVESQVPTMRGRVFQPRLKFASLEELNEWLEAECRRWAAMQPHPEQKDMTVAQALEMELPALQPMLAPFDGFHETEHAVTGTCLISFDRKRYSVMSSAVRRPVQVRAYTDRIIVRCGDTVVAEHARHFGRDQMILDPWLYLPVLTDGLDAVEDAIREALEAGVASDEVVLNILARCREPPRLFSIGTADDLALAHPPVANCARYDSLRDIRAAA